MTRSRRRCCPVSRRGWPTSAPRPSSLTDLVVRACHTEPEVDAFCDLAARTFRPEREPVEEARRRKARYRAAPWHDPEQLRGAFLDGEFVGGYLIEERVLRVGEARLTTGCIGAVMVRPEHRGRGIARELMADSAAFAERRRLALVLLCGINDMYARFGYADVFDPTEQIVPHAKVLELPASPCRVRPGTIEDAEALLDLYRRHFWRHPGAFDRTLAEQRWRIESYRGAPDVAVDPSGRIRGYATAPVGDKRQRIEEVVADGWPALLALLHHHAAQAPDAEELGWWLPPTSPTFWLLADRLSLRSVAWRVLDGEWMAKPGHLQTLLEALAPVWRTRLGRLGAGAAGAVVVDVRGGASFWLQVETGQPATSPDPAWPRLRLTPQDFTQLVFGYRPVDTLAAADGLAPGALGVLKAAFPYGQGWIPGSDAF